MTTETMHSEATHLPRGDETVKETGSKRRTQKLNFILKAALMVHAGAWVHRKLGFQDLNIPQKLGFKTKDISVPQPSKLPVDFFGPLEGPLS